jgi:enoyl-[acyl-carrier protein] reductase II
LVAALAMGAQGVVMGTRFIASDEAHALDSWKQRIVAAAATDTTLTRCYSGKQMRGFRNHYTDSWIGREADILPFPQQMEVSLREGVLDMFGTSEDPDRGCLPTGQSCGGVHDIKPAAAVMADFLAEAQTALARLPVH